MIEWVIHLEEQFGICLAELAMIIPVSVVHFAVGGVFCFVNTCYILLVE